MGGAFSFGKKKDAAKGSGDNSLANYNVGTDTVEYGNEKLKGATHKKSGRKVVIRTVNKSEGGYDAARIKHEVKVLKQLKHPSCVGLVEVIDSEANFYILFEALGGSSLAARIETNKRGLPEGEAASVAVDVFNALAHLASVDIAHRAVSPWSIVFLTDDPSLPEFHSVKLVDFSLSRAETDKAMTTMKTLCGDPLYAAPEMLSTSMDGGAKKYGPEVDLWSIGVVLYEMLTGAPPFFSEDTPKLFRTVSKGGVDFPSPDWDDIDTAARHLISQLIHVDPVQRDSAARCRSHPWIEHATQKRNNELNERRRAIMLISNLPNLKNAKLECIKQLTSNLRNVRRFEDIPVHEAGAKGDYMFLVEAGAVTVSVGGEQVAQLPQEEGQELLNAQKPKAGGGQLEKTRYVYDEARPRSAGSDGVMEEHEDPELAALADDLPGLYRLSKADFLRLSTKFPELKTALVLTDQERQERLLLRGASAGRLMSSSGVGRASSGWTRPEPAKVKENKNMARAKSGGTDTMIKATRATSSTMAPALDGWKLAKIDDPVHGMGPLLAESRTERVSSSKAAAKGGE